MFFTPTLIIQTGRSSNIDFLCVDGVQKFTLCQQEHGQQEHGFHEDNYGVIGLLYQSDPFQC